MRIAAADAILHAGSARDERAFRRGNVSGVAAGGEPERSAHSAGRPHRLWDDGRGTWAVLGAPLGGGASGNAGDDAGAEAARLGPVQNGAADFEQRARGLHPARTHFLAE